MNVARLRRSCPSVLRMGLSGLALAGAVTGCAVPARPVATGGDVLAGRISIRVEAAGGEPERSLASSFELRGDAQRGSFSLSTPIGTTLAQARWSPQDVVLVTPEGQRPFPDLPALMRDMFGQPLPVAALFDWLRGRPWPGAESLEARPPDEAGFAQLGWQVTLARFDEGFIEARRIEPPVVTVRARLDRP